MGTTATGQGSATPGGTLAIGGDLVVNRLGFGAMRITGEGIWGEPPDRQAALSVLRRAVELGVTFIDTADSYGPEVSENLIAEALHPYPSGLVIATKGGLERTGPGQWPRNARPARLKAACEASLRRLRLECIDLYQLHWPDPRVPYEESVGALVELQREGKIRHIGVSNVDAGLLARARALATVVSVQNPFNLTSRQNEDVLATCERDGLAFMPYFPLAAGPLTQPGGALDHIAAAHGATQGQIALAWLLRRSPVMLPIPGTSQVAHLEENVAAAAITLSDREMATLSGQPQQAT